MSMNVNDISLSLRDFIVNWLHRWSFALDHRTAGRMHEAEATRKKRSAGPSRGRTNASD